MIENNYTNISDLTGKLSSVHDTILVMVFRSSIENLVFSFFEREFLQNNAQAIKEAYRK